MNNSIKVFNVSKPRCATQSMHNFLTSLGYDSMHWFGHFLTINYDDLSTEKEIIDTISPLEETFNAFNDFPYTILYDHFANKYPDAKFIMINRDLDDWYLSFQKLLKHNDPYKKFLTNLEKVFYGKYIQINNEEQPLLSKKELFEFYKAHKKDVESYFSGTDRLLNISISDDEISQKICKFLNIKSSYVFPNKDFLGGENNEICNSAC